MDFTFLEVTNDNLLEEVFAFRYKVISETKIFEKYFLETDFKNNKESDLYDQYSVHFVALDNKKNICATVRLIYQSPCGYPVENCMIFDKTQFERDKIGEISRIFIDKQYRNLTVTKEILFNIDRLLYIKMRELKIEYTYGALEPRFVRLLRINKMRYDILAEKQPHGKMGLRYPCILYTKRMGDDNPEFLKAWNDKHVL